MSFAARHFIPLRLEASFYSDHPQYNSVSPLPAMNADRTRRARRPSREDDDGDECDQRRREVDDDRARLAPGAGPSRRRRARGALPARGTCVQQVTSTIHEFQ